MVGITKYIKTQLQNNVAFNPIPFKSKSVKGKQMGLQIGRYTDLLFRRAFEKKVVLNPTNYRHRRCCAIFATLKQQGVTVHQVQVPVKHEALGIQTQLDALGMTKTGCPCVIELKTTQYTLAEHIQCYTRRCRVQPQLRNGLPNTEQVVHGLQAAFGVLALQKQRPHCTKPMCALVIVAASDGAKAYWTDSGMINPLCFQVTAVPTTVSALPTKRDKKTPFHPWPQHDTLKCLQTCLRARGYIHSTPNRTTTLFCSGLAYATKNKPHTVIALIGIHRGVHTPTTPVYTKYIQQLRHDAVKLHKRQKTSCRIDAYLMTPHQNTFKCVRVTLPLHTQQ